MKVKKVIETIKCNVAKLSKKVASKRAVGISVRTGAQKDINQRIEDIQQNIIAQNNMINELYKMLKYNTDRQYYFNAFHNPELLKLEKHPEGDILLCGNYGDPNLGDEWMLETILSYLKEKTKARVTVMLRPNRVFDTSAYVKYDIDYIHYPQTIYDYDILVNKFDTVIFGGGAIIEDDVYWNAYDYGVHICRTLVDLPLRFFEKNKKVFCIGLSTSKKLSNKEYLCKLQTLIDNATYFSVRDTNSINTMKEAGLDCSNVKLINDIVYGNKMLDCGRVIRSDKKINSIGIIYIINDYTKQSLNDLIKNINKNHADVEITLIPFYDNWNHDIRYFNESIKNFTNVKVDSFDIGIDGTIEKLKKHDLIISMRYHGVLLSLIMGMKTVCVYFDNHPHYYNKIDYLLKQYGWDISKTIKESEISGSEDSIIEKYMIKLDDNVPADILAESKLQLEKIFDLI